MYVAMHFHTPENGGEIGSSQHIYDASLQAFHFFVVSQRTYPCPVSAPSPPASAGLNDIISYPPSVDDHSVFHERVQVLTNAPGPSFFPPTNDYNNIAG